MARKAKRVFSKIPPAVKPDADPSPAIEEHQIEAQISMPIIWYKCQRGTKEIVIHGSIPQISDINENLSQELVPIMHIIGYKLPGQQIVL